MLESVNPKVKCHIFPSHWYFSPLTWWTNLHNVCNVQTNSIFFFVWLKVYILILSNLLVIKLTEGKISNSQCAVTICITSSSLYCNRWLSYFASYCWSQIKWRCLANDTIGITDLKWYQYSSAFQDSLAGLIFVSPHLVIFSKRR